jgi:DNA repair exonuclease SbcCD ATPase subunit
MADVDLDARLDELFASEPGQFTAVRDALVRDLRAERRADEAAEVKALRRPTMAVAAVNRTARERSEQMAALVEIGAELTALQLGSGAHSDELRDLARQRRALLHQLTEHAASTTARPEGARSAITATLDAASLDEHLHDDLQRGRLTRELAPATRFVLGADESSPVRATPRPATRAKSTAPPRDELAARRARAELEAVRARAEEADDSVREHTEAAAVATARLEAAHRHIADLEAALADARAELTDLERVEREAQRAERRARTEQERVTAALHASERAVDDPK